MIVYEESLEMSWKVLTLKIKRALGMHVILCDSCMFDWRGACRNPERPNATLCDEYRKRGS